MPVASPLTPKSVLRHRPLFSHETTHIRPTVARASRPPQRTRAQETVPPFVCIRKAAVPHKKTLHLSNILVPIGMGMLVALLAVLLGQALLSWCATTWNDLNYGRPRTYQTDAFVGHEPAHTPSHFVVLNLHGHIEILELPGGDPTQTKLYLGPQIGGTGADLVPVTVQFLDPHHTHHPDMIVQFQGTQVLFHNVHGAFQLGQP